MEAPAVPLSLRNLDTAQQLGCLTLLAGSAAWCSLAWLLLCALGVQRMQRLKDAEAADAATELNKTVKELQTTSEYLAAVTAELQARAGERERGSFACMGQGSAIGVCCPALCPVTAGRGSHRHLGV